MKKLTEITKTHKLEAIVKAFYPGAPEKSDATSEVQGGDRTWNSPGDEKQFMKFHRTVKMGDRNKNDDKLFNASNIKKSETARHGYCDQDDCETAAFEPRKEEVEHLDEVKKKDRAAYARFWAHDPEQGERIRKFGEKERSEAKAFKSAKAEIDRLKKRNEETELDERVVASGIKHRINKIKRPIKQNFITGDDIQDFNAAKTKPVKKDK